MWYLLTIFMILGSNFFEKYPKSGKGTTSWTNTVFFILGLKIMEMPKWYRMIHTENSFQKSSKSAKGTTSLTYMAFFNLDLKIGKTAKRYRMIHA